MRLLLVILSAVTELFASMTVVEAEWPAATVGSKEVWEAAADRASQTRFIPLQLIVPGVWDGTRRIDLPAASLIDAEGTTWSGPQEWRHPHTGQVLTVYDRRRTNRREGTVEQKMAVRADGAAIGRAWD